MCQIWKNQQEMLFYYNFKLLTNIWKYHQRPKKIFSNKLQIIVN